MTDAQNLGIGSRVRHHDYGDGVVINVKTNTYYITFVTEGAKDISRVNPWVQVVSVQAPQNLPG